MSFEQAVVQLEQTNAALQEEVIRFRDAAMGLNAIYPTITEGRQAVADGKYFSVPGSGAYMRLYRRQGSSAELIAEFPDRAELNSVIDQLGPLLGRGVVGGGGSDLIALGGFGLGSVTRDIRSGESVNFKGLGRGIYGVDRPVVDSVTGVPSYSPGNEYAAHLPINMSSPGSSINSILSFFPTSRRIIYGINTESSLDPVNYEPFELLHHKRILGAVAFANGLPSGALFESGQNSNGYYLKFANGTLICFGNKSVNFNIESAYGPLYASGFTETITFPHSFEGAPYGLDTTVADGSGARGALFSIKPASPLETSVAIRAIAVAVLTTAQFNVSYFAIGNWRAL
ncbi:hypothetical protein [Halomonas sp. Cn5-12]|jgi:hypothetical protein|uniref:hypothetical protein n=1 Tax=Halomonas sp. Cn5-12 TaxID=2908885 RepID=UPI001F1E08C1|nr:hypothetical protein [Halomonas sp. Cn5-12]MCF2911912.1 hypothetical protein [Halomonas sp. Cn5-12]